MIFSNALFGSLEREESRGEVVEKRVKRMVFLHFVWMLLKLVRGKRIISSSSCLDVLKIRLEMR